MALVSTRVFLPIPPIPPICFAIFLNISLISAFPPPIPFILLINSLASFMISSCEISPLFILESSLLPMVLTKSIIFLGFFINFLRTSSVVFTSDISSPPIIPVISLVNSSAISLANLPIFPSKRSFKCSCKSSGLGIFLKSNEFLNSSILGIFGIFSNMFSNIFSCSDSDGP